MTNIVILGAGVVGATIAYELSLIPDVNITVVERNLPYSGSTGAALGVLMGIISQKTKGRAWRLRQQSIKRYPSLIQELENLTGEKIFFNRQGILKILSAEGEIDKWKKLQQKRKKEGWQLEIMPPDELRHQYPQLNLDKKSFALYSPQDGQVNPQQLTASLLEAASLQGVNIHWQTEIKNIISKKIPHTDLLKCCEIATENSSWQTDWLIIAAGLGSTALTQSLQATCHLQPVLGQALHFKLLEQNQSLSSLLPVITRDDVHIVPLPNQEYWVGATVEFADEKGIVEAQEQLLEEVKQKALQLYPVLAKATLLNSWSGLRPRPQGQSAPVIKELSGYSNVLLATGHYRNGVLLAPATAQAIKAMLQPKLS